MPKLLHLEEGVAILAIAMMLEGKKLYIPLIRSIHLLAIVQSEKKTMIAY